MLELRTTRTNPNPSCKNTKKCREIQYLSWATGGSNKDMELIIAQVDCDNETQAKQRPPRKLKPTDAGDAGICSNCTRAWRRTCSDDTDAQDDGRGQSKKEGAVCRQHRLNNSSTQEQQNKGPRLEFEKRERGGD